MPLPPPVMRATLPSKRPLANMDVCVSATRGRLHRPSRRRHSAVTGKRGAPSRRGRRFGFTARCGADNTAETPDGTLRVVTMPGGAELGGLETQWWPPHGGVDASTRGREDHGIRE